MYRKKSYRKRVQAIMEMIQENRKNKHNGIGK